MIVACGEIGRCLTIGAWKTLTWITVVGLQYPFKPHTDGVWLSRTHLPQNISSKVALKKSLYIQIYRTRYFRNVCMSTLSVFNAGSKYRIYIQIDCYRNCLFPLDGNSYDWKFLSPWKSNILLIPLILLWHSASQIHVKTIILKNQLSWYKSSESHALYLLPSICSNLLH